MANLARAVATPIHLLACGNISQISSMLAAGGGDWAMFKADRRAAYKQLPIDPADQTSEVIAPKRPVGNRWYSFVTRALIFGSLAAVLRHNALSRLLFAKVNRYIGMPRVG